MQNIIYCFTHIAVELKKNLQLGYLKQIKKALNLEFLLKKTYDVMSPWLPAPSAMHKISLHYSK